MIKSPITSFLGEYRFLSNFYPAPVSYLGLRYPTVEHAFQAMVEEFVQRGHVIFEGLVVTNVFMMWVEMAHDLRTKYGSEFWFLPMNTPLEVCKERIQERNGGKEVSDKNTIKTWESNQRSAKKAEEAGFNVQWINWKAPMESLGKVFLL